MQASVAPSRVLVCVADSMDCAMHLKNGVELEGGIRSCAVERLRLKN